MCNEHTLIRSTNILSRNHHVLDSEEKAGVYLTVFINMNLVSIIISCLR